LFATLDTYDFYLHRAAMKSVGGLIDNFGTMLELGKVYQGGSIKFCCLSGFAIWYLDLAIPSFGQWYLIGATTLLAIFPMIFLALLPINAQFLDREGKHMVFTREYTQCTAGYTFCFVVVVVVGGGVVVGVVVVVVVVVVATFSQTWHYFSRQLIQHD
jgi:hypothetical protein